MSRVTKNERIHALEQQVKGLIDGYKILSRHVDCTSENLVSSPLIERDKVELTGSDLCRAMLDRGDTHVMCLVFDDTRNLDVTYVIRRYYNGYFHTTRSRWENAVPINNQGEPLTASEVGIQL